MTAVILVACLGYCLRPVVEEGVVAAKGISGEREGSVYTIIRFHETGVNPKISDWRSLFPNTTRLTAQAEAQLKWRYTDIRYIVNVRTEIRTMGYYASKEDFNSVEPGDAVRFRILHRRDPTIKIVEVLHRETG